MIQENDDHQDGFPFRFQDLSLTQDTFFIGMEWLGEHSRFCLQHDWCVNGLYLKKQYIYIYVYVRIGIRILILWCLCFQMFPKTWVHHLLAVNEPPRPAVIGQQLVQVNLPIWSWWIRTYRIMMCLRSFLLLNLGPNETPSRNNQQNTLESLEIFFLNLLISQILSFLISRLSVFKYCFVLWFLGL